MSFGTGFGSVTPGNQSAFSFGTGSSTATPAKPTFGTGSFSFNTPATSAPNLFGTAGVQPTGFGTTPAFGTATGGLASSGFGTTTTNTTTFGFGSNPTTAGIFGSNVPTATFGLGAATSTTPSSTFGGFNSFGTTTTTAPTIFGGFNNANPISTGFGTGFGAKAPATSASAFSSGLLGPRPSFTGFSTNFNQPQLVQSQSLPQPQNQQSTIAEALYNAVFNCQLFNDERDNTIARWNLIQALWGTGKAYYSPNAQPVELNQENPLCRFKAIGYSCMPTSDNNDGIITLHFNKKAQELKDNKPQLIGSFDNILGNKPNLSINIDSIKSLGETKSQIGIFVTEKGVTGSVRRIPANELINFLNTQKPALQLLGVDNLFAQVKLDPAQLKEYLDNPPCSIDPRLWKQAQLDNPNPQIYIPVPMIGFQQVQNRLKCQEELTNKHRAFLDMAAERIQGLQRQHTATQARLKEHRRALLELQHRVLQILVRQEITRKIGLSLQPEEELLTNRFEAMHSQISAPTQFKGRISEMLSQLRMRRYVDMQNQERYSMDPIAQDDIKTFLSMQQQGMAQLIETINVDIESLQIIKDGMADLLTSHAAS